ncbi:latrophilin Cirl-like isoform X2 [Silurus meridionalis]|uniref:latrophilin Cirl-like isoform X2 n=1 Tax=Silurus meridionalis TaxID=175797 RepID=UPI001EEB255E|nr:latrophilin Cirl-like isoform X2 [Silurus meridionalis]
MVLLINNVAVLIIAAVTACATSPSDESWTFSDDCQVDLNTCLTNYLQKLNNNCTTNSSTVVNIECHLNTIVNFTSLVVYNVPDQDLTSLRKAVLDVNWLLLSNLMNKINDDQKFSVQNLEVLLIKRRVSSGPYNLVNVSVTIDFTQPSLMANAAVVFMSYTNISSLFSIVNQSTETTIMSPVVSARFLSFKPDLTKPVDFTLTHITPLDPNAFLSCMDWETNSWDTCSLTQTSSTKSVCSCKNLTMFALISQTDPCSLNLTLQCAMDFLDQTQQNIVSDLSQETVKGYLNTIMNLTNFINQSSQNTYGNLLMNVTEKLASRLVTETATYNSTTISLQTLELRILTVGPKVNLSRTPTLVTSSATMDIDLIGISKNNKGSAAVAFISYTNMSNILQADFKAYTDVNKVVMSVVVSATLPKTANTNLTKLYNFTLKHLTALSPENILSCMYWNENAWHTDYCNVTETNSSHTVCSCNQLGTVLLIMQTDPCKILKYLPQELPQEIVKNYLKIMISLTARVTANVIDQNYLISYGNDVLNVVENLVSTLVRKDSPDTKISLSLQNCEVQVLMIHGPNVSLSDIPELGTTNTLIVIDLIEIAKNNNGSAAVAFVRYTNMTSLLKPSLLKTTTSPNKTMLSDVLSVSLLKNANQNLTKPINVTFKHIHEFNPEGILSCVYWNKDSWIDNCSIIWTNSTHTVCSCAHLSTFALIMRTEPCRSDHLMNMSIAGATAAGLVFLSLSLLTLLFYSRNPVTDAALINLCINLLVFYILSLIKSFSLPYIHPLHLRTALVGIQWFFLMSVFVWMFIEAVLLYIFVRNLSEIKSNLGEVISWKWLIAIGYLVPLGVLGMSAIPFPKGYIDEECSLNTDETLIFIFASPVLFTVTLNLVPYLILIVVVAVNRQPLMNEVFQMRNSSDKSLLKCMMVRSLTQFVVLICYWIFLYIPSKNGILYHAFLFLNSQQGTVIFFTHCLLNKQIRQKYKKLLCASNNPGEASRSVRGQPEDSQDN